MNMISSNVNQWTMLAAMLPIAYALALGSLGTIHFDEHQRLEILMTIGQSLLGALLLANMRFAWWEAALLFALWAIQFLLSGFERPLDVTAGSNRLAVAASGWSGINVETLEALATEGKKVITASYFAWAAVIIVFSARRAGGGFKAIRVFPKLMREHW
jgi:hypothetical protein